ncbi:MAG: hypothetical protein K2X47_14945 [Bdellovibrionales bacterium]|nr:hypothetical protein [Bdellovibrionales bacterium]
MFQFIISTLALLFVVSANSSAPQALGSCSVYSYNKIDGELDVTSRILLDQGQALTYFDRYGIKMWQMYREYEVDGKKVSVNVSLSTKAVELPLYVKIAESTASRSVAHSEGYHSVSGLKFNFEQFSQTLNIGVACKN